MADDATTNDTADESTADSVETEASATEATTTEGESALGDAGKKALDAMKADRNAAKAETKKIADEYAAFKAQAEGTQAEFEAAQKTRELERAALAKADERILKAEIRAAAAGKLNDPKDALSFLDISTLEVGEDGEVDGAAVAAAIDELIRSKPYLAAQGKRFEGDADGGARKESGPTQLTKGDLSRMSPEEINSARAEGRLNDVLGIKTA